MTKSDVGLALFREDYEQMRKENQIIDQFLENSGPVITKIDKYIFIYWEWITWFPLSNPEQKALEKYLDDHEETVPYKFIELSEDLDYSPTIISNNVGERDCEIFGITRKLDLY